MSDEQPETPPEPPRRPVTPFPPAPPVVDPDDGTITRPVDSRPPGWAACHGYPRRR